MITLGCNKIWANVYCNLGNISMSHFSFFTWKNCVVVKKRKYMLQFIYFTLSCMVEKISHLIYTPTDKKKIHNMHLNGKKIQIQFNATSFNVKKCLFLIQQQHFLHLHWTRWNWKTAPQAYLNQNRYMRTILVENEEKFLKTVLDRNVFLQVSDDFCKE